MVKALRFKGDKKAKKRKRAAPADGDPDSDSGTAPKAAKPDTSSTNTGAADDEEEGWVDSDCLEDLTGPLLFAFAAATPICLAADAAGKVFASPLTTCEGEDLSTAAPTDVQQVWVVAPVYGTTTGKVSFRAHTGRYLSCDKHGLLTATREAIGPEEEFALVRSTLGGARWAVQTCRDLFVAVDEVAAGGAVAVRGDAAEVGFAQTWTVRLQKRNKKRGKGGKGGEKGVMKDRATRKELEELAGVSLTDEQVKMLRRAKREGGLHEALLDVRVKHGKHDKFAY
ncbi:FRG1-like family-domain-containing protein [Geopyxis carbonaria]|nr:FRG1-like family-domain-containing protein [Geopyxis carbonaria]